MGKILNNPMRGGIGVILVTLSLMLAGCAGESKEDNQDASPTIEQFPGGLGRDANNKITSNAQWTPVIQEFDGVEMALVPAGCFMMGSTDEQIDFAISVVGRPEYLELFEGEQPVHEICFDQPFWIDKYEVSQAQFAQFGGQKVHENAVSRSTFPVEQITWFEARDYCQLRGAHLPTEAEWEYAARGPDNFIYPWGNEFIGDNVVYDANSDQRTAAVGSKPGGVSWVGALDMSGNVWEWMSTIYDRERFPYPYNGSDGREANDDTNSERVTRGGAFNYLADILRAASRGGLPPGQWYAYFGLRCARSY